MILPPEPLDEPIQYLPDEIALTAEDLARLNAELIRLRSELAARRSTEQWRARVIALARGGLKGEKPPKKIFNEIIEACRQNDAI